jgi:hypothetical protein
VEICELTVRDNEHDSERVVGDDDVALSDVAEGGTAQERQGKSRGNDLGVCRTSEEDRCDASQRSHVTNHT